MKISNFRFWPRSATGEVSSTDEDKVIALHSVENQEEIESRIDSPLDMPAGISGIFPLSGTGYIDPKPSQHPKGLLHAAPIAEFFSRNFVTSGRYAGATQGTVEARDQGTATVIAQFQSALHAVIDEKRSVLAKIKDFAAQSNGVSDVVSTRLHLAIEKLERDLLELNQQLALAEGHRGWILSALNEYRLGFDRGLREAVDAELIGL